MSEANVGDYYKPSSTNASYENIFKDERIKNVIEKYKKLFEKEIKAGRAELDINKRANIQLDENDIEILKPLIAFNDAYVINQIEK
ncbi:UNVERIFIED_CONTAM: hypothetical protein O8I53_11730 [Campylobacter lari]